MKSFFRLFQTNVKTLIFSIFFFVISTIAAAQIVRTIPEYPKLTDTVQIVFDASQGNAALKNFSGDVYFHAGLITASSQDENDWKFVVGDWGKPDARVKMKPLGGNLFVAKIWPSAFFGVAADLKVNRLALVFRNEDGTIVGKTKDEQNIFVDFEVYTPPADGLLKILTAEKSYRGQQIIDGTLVIQTDQGDISFRPFSDSIVEVMLHPDGFNGFDSSHAVVAQPELPECLLTEAQNALMFDLPGLEVFVKKNPFSIGFLTNGTPFLEEELGFFEGSAGTGVRFKKGLEEKYYGSGGRASGMALNGKKLGLYNRADYNYEFGAYNLNYMIPLLVSSNKYMLLYDNPEKGFIDVDSDHDGILEFSTAGGPQRYYLIYGKDYKSLLHQYSWLTGRQPMPPRWALGNLQSRMAYRTQAETDSIVNLMLKEDFPVDAVILDFYWFGDSIKGHLGRLDWFRPSWPEPEKMISDFKAKGIKTILISEPYIIDSLANFKIASDLDILVKDSLGNDYIDKQFYFGNGALIDIFKPAAGDWLWSKYKQQFDQGVAGLWGDLGEPESHPSDMVHVAGTADEVHGIYGHYWAKSIYDRFRRDFPDKRLFFLARAGFAGSQRFGMVPWSGDVSRSWGGLKAQLPAMLNMSLSGVPYMHSDAGGFAQGVKDDELYTRWLQFAVFTPILRPHGSGVPSEPVYFNDTTKNIVRHFMKMRYQLLPYIYTLSWKAEQFGSPIVRPLMYEYPQDERFANHFETYLFGRDLLIAPVTSPGLQRMSVDLPQGLWYHFWTKQKIRGGGNVSVNVALESIPVFVRGGSILPMTESIGTTADYSSRKLFLHVFLPDGNASMSTQVFEDDGEEFDSYAKGNYELLEIEGETVADNLQLHFHRSGNGYAGMPELRMLELMVYGKDGDYKKIQLNENELQPLNREQSDKNQIGYWKEKDGAWHIRFLWAGEDIELNAR